MKFCKRTFQGYSSKLNKSREKSFCLSKRKKEKTMNPNNLSRDHHRDKYNSVAWKENSQNSCFLVKKCYYFEDIFNVLLGYIKFTSLSILFFVGTFWAWRHTQNTKWAIWCMLYHKQMFIHSFYTAKIKEWANIWM